MLKMACRPPDADGCTPSCNDWQQMQLPLEYTYPMRQVAGRQEPRGEQCGVRARRASLARRQILPLLVCIPQGLTHLPCHGSVLQKGGGGPQFVLQ